MITSMIDHIKTFINRFKNANQKLFRNAVSITDSDDADDGFIRIIPTGYFPEHHDGAHEVTADHIREMEQNFNNSSTDVLFDYDHASMYGESKAAAWSSEVQAREDGLYIKYPEFTKPASELIANKEYRYFSPVYTLSTKDKKGKSIGAKIVSVAITNTPYFDEGEISSIKNRKEYKNMTKEFLESLGLTEDATAEEIEAAVKAKIAELEAAREGDEAGDGGAAANSGNAGTNNSAAKSNSVNSALEETVKSLTKKLEAIQNSSRENEIEAILNSAISAEKILPRDKKAYANSLRHDFDATKKELDEIEAGAVAEETLKVNKGNKGGNEQIVNKTASAVAALKANRSKQ